MVDKKGTLNEGRRELIDVLRVDGGDENEFPRVAAALEQNREHPLAVLNDLHRFHRVTDTIDRLPQTVDKGVCLKQQLKDKLIEHKQYNAKHGQDLPEIRRWEYEATCE